MKRIECLGCLMLIFISAFSAFAAEKVYFYHTDPAGTPLAMTDSSGNVVWRADYLPFGEENVITGALENDLRFVGKEQDQETGLYYFGARYMEPMIGRFISPDPVGITNKDLLNPQRLNRYSYGLNNPHRYLDPDGRLSIEIHRKITMDIFTGSGFSERAAKSVAKGNISVDLNPFSPPYEHCQRGLESRDEAIKASEDIMKNRLREAGRLIASRDYEGGLRELGKGLHTTQDRIHNWITSDEHTLIEVRKDNDPSPEDRARAISDTRKYLEDFWSTLKDDLKLSERQIEKIKQDLKNY